MSLYTLDVRLGGPRNLLGRASDEKHSTPAANPLSSHFTEGFFVHTSILLRTTDRIDGHIATSCRILLW
jgi:hypothetical protein